MYDAIIVGAGPAGNVAALRLSSKGHRVAVLDWRFDIGDKLCTGIVGTECGEAFPIPSELIYRQANSATFISPNGREFGVVSRRDQALVVDRVAYINEIAETAMNAGASYHLGHRVSGIEIDDTSVRVRVRASNNSTTFSAKLLILSSGFGSPLIRMAGLREGKDGDFMMGAQTEVEIGNVSDTEVYVGDQIAPEAFGWIVPLDEFRAHVGLMSHHPLNGHLDSFQSRLKERGKILDDISAPRRWGIPLKPIPRTYADRTLVTGDAAGFAKPTTGGGIYYAMLSGQMAAAAAIKAFECGDFSAAQLKGYEDDWKKVFGHELKVGYYARLLFESMNDTQLDRMMEMFLSPEVQQDTVLSSDFSFDWHGKTILKTVRHQELGPLITSFGAVVAPFFKRLIRSSIF